MKRIDKLIGQSYSIQKYKDLTREYQLAIAFYMAVEGEAWDDFLNLTEWHSKDAARDVLVKLLPQYVKEYAQTRWGVVTLSANCLMKAIVQDQEIAPNFGSWQEYADWFKNNNAVSPHPTTNLWPVILSSTDDETLQDGWHRLHSYVNAGIVEIPAVFYQAARHLPLDD